MERVGTGRQLVTYWVLGQIKIDETAPAGFGEGELDFGRVLTNFCDSRKEFEIWTRKINVWIQHSKAKRLDTYQDIAERLLESVELSQPLDLDDVEGPHARRDHLPRPTVSAQARWRCKRATWKAKVSLQIDARGSLWLERRQWVFSLGAWA